MDAPRRILPIGLRPPRNPRFWRRLHAQLGRTVPLAVVWRNPWRWLNQTTGATPHESAHPGRRHRAPTVHPFVPRDQ
jgi:cytochrome b561